MRLVFRVRAHGGAGIFGHRRLSGGGYLGYESLSSGVWYVAIDSQLFAVMAVLLWLGGRTAQWLVAFAMLFERWVERPLSALRIPA